MKFALVILAVVAAASAQYQPNVFNNYRNRFPTSPPPTYRAYSTPAPAPVYSTIVPKYATPQAPVYKPVVAKYNSNLEAGNANIVKYGNEINPDGSYNYFYETENGIAAQEQGVPRNLGGNPPAIPVVAQGSFSWTSPEGVPVGITYTADEYGYQPQGSAIPTPPPVPAQIARALDYIARNNKF